MPKTKKARLTPNLDYGELIDQCVKENIPVLKRDGDVYAASTLLTKLKEHQNQVTGHKVTGHKVPKQLVTGQVGGRSDPKKELSVEKVEEPSKLESAILEDPLIRAHLEKKRGKKGESVKEETVTLGIIMAAFGNHVDLGASGLGPLLPDFLENEKLKKYWKEKGVVRVTPQTEIPVRFIYLLED